MTPYYSDESVTLWHGDALSVLSALAGGSVNCCVTSPPYFGLRDYGVDGQYGLEASPAEYVETMRALFAEVRRVLADDGTLWLNLGDSYSSAAGGAPTSGNIDTNGGTRFVRPRVQDFIPAKNLLGVPWQVAFALQDDGWILRNAIVWHKSNAMPESVTDRLSCDYEHLFLFAKSKRYWFDLDAIREPLAYPDALDGTRVFGGVNKGTGEGKVGAAARRGGLHRSTYGRPDPTPYPKGVAPQAIRAATGKRHTHASENGRNPGSVWTIPTQPFTAAHFAVMPVTLAERCIKAGCKPGGIVLDPFSGSGTTGLAATKHGRRYVGIDLNRDYLDLSLQTRLSQTALIDEVDA